MDLHAEVGVPVFVVRRGDELAVTTEHDPDAIATYQVPQAA